MSLPTQSNYFSKVTVMNSSHFYRVIEGLCNAIGFSEPSILVQGAKLRIDENLVSFIYDEPYNPNTAYVYVDMGAPKENLDDVYKKLLKINFGLSAGERGVMSLHPETNHLFYSFCFPLSEEATGRGLLDALTRFIGGVGIEALELPEDKKNADKSAASAARARMARMLATESGIANPA